MRLDIVPASPSISDGRYSRGTVEGEDFAYHPRSLPFDYVRGRIVRLQKFKFGYILEVQVGFTFVHRNTIPSEAF